LRTCGPCDCAPVRASPARPPTELTNAVVRNRVCSDHLRPCALHVGVEDPNDRLRRTLPSATLRFQLPATRRSQRVVARAAAVLRDPRRSELPARSWGCYY